MKDDKKSHSSESDRLARIQVNLAKAKELSARLEKKYGKVPPRSEEENEWRWRQIMRHKRFLDEE
jgi:hypothetical protein